LLGARGGCSAHLAQLYTTEELVELVRDNLRFVEALPPGLERDRHQQIVDGLRAHFRDKSWPAGIEPVVHDKRF
jgi:hypothetical protein